MNTDKVKRSQEFYSKKDLLNWLEENSKYIDWDFETVELNFYWKDGESR